MKCPQRTYIYTLGLSIPAKQYEVDGQERPEVLLQCICEEIHRPQLDKWWVGSFNLSWVSARGQEHRLHAAAGKSFLSFHSIFILLYSILRSSK